MSLYIDFFVYLFHLILIECMFFEENQAIESLNEKQGGGSIQAIQWPNNMVTFFALRSWILKIIGKYQIIIFISTHIISTSAITHIRNINTSRITITVSNV